MNGRIIVHSLAQAEAAVAAAAALDRPVTLSSAPGAGAYAGARWFKALIEAAATTHPETAITAILDCGEEAGAVLGALRLGLCHLRFTGPATTWATLTALAAESGAVVEGNEPVTAIDLRNHPNPLAACRAFLAEGGTE